MGLNINLASAPQTTRGRLYEILARVDMLPILDDRSEEEILCYDENGLPR